LTIDIHALEPSQRLYAGTLVILEIATDHVRTPGAITVRRVKLGLIEASPRVRSKTEGGAGTPNGLLLQAHRKTSRNKGTVIPDSV
jgi:hypothetical protein